MLRYLFVIFFSFAISYEIFHQNSFTREELEMIEERLSKIQKTIQIINENKSINEFDSYLIEKIQLELFSIQFLINRKVKND